MQTDEIFERLDEILEGFTKFGVPPFVADCQNPNILWKFLIDQIHNQILILHGETMRFQDFYTLKESPLTVKLTPEVINEFNLEAAKYVSNPMNVIETILIQNIYIEIQKDVKDTTEELLFIDQETRDLIFRYKYTNRYKDTKFHDGIIENHIWQSLKYKGFAQRIYLTYILKMFTYIITDKIVTEKGNNFLLKIYQILILDKNYQLGVINIKNNQIIKIFQHPEQIQTDWKIYFNNKIESNMDDIRLFIKKV